MRSYNHILNNQTAHFRSCLGRYDLPGDTGYGKLDPNSSFASSCSVSISPDMPKPWTINSHKLYTFSIKCDNGTADISLFYVRVVGCSILSPIASRQNHQDSTFEFDFFFHEGGNYFMDVVLEFTNVTELTMEHDFETQDRTYIGYPIKDSPLPLSVIQQVATEEKPLCDIGSLSPKLDPAFGRWILQSHPYLHAPKNITEIEFLDSLSFFWEPWNCKLPHVPKKGWKRWSCSNKNAEVWMFGDSTIHIQFERSKLFTFPFEWEMTHQDTSGGMEIMFGPIEEALKKIKIKNDEGKKVVLLFNSGLHDIDKYCHPALAWWRTDNNIPGGETCTDRYARNMEKFVSLVEKYNPNGINIFRSTLAAWQKWGNVGVFNPDADALVLSHYSPKFFNGIAKKVIAKHPKVFWIDGYSVSIGRPDHTERKPGNGHHVHFGLQVSDYLNDLMVSIIDRELCNH